MSQQPGGITITGSAVPKNDGGVAPFSTTNFAPRELVYVPGGSFPNASPWSLNQCTDFSLITAALGALAGETQLEFDATHVAIVIAGGSYNFGKFCTWRAPSTSDANAISIATGVVFATLPVEFRNCLVALNNLATTPWTIDVGALGAANVVVDGAQLFGSPTGALFALTDPSALAGTVTVDLVRSGQLNVHAFNIVDGTLMLVINARGDGVVIGTTAVTGTLTNLIVNVLSNGATIAPEFGPHIQIASGVTLAIAGNPITSSIPAATSLGGFVEDTATGVVWYSDGTSWTPLAPTSVVFQPGGTASPGVYTDFGVACAILLALAVRGDRTLYIDCQFSSDTFDLPAGAFDHGPNVTWLGLLNQASGSFPSINFVNETTLTSPPNEISQIFVSVNQVAAPITYATGQNGPVLYITRDTEVSCAAGSAPFVQVNSGTTLYIEISGGGDAGFFVSGGDRCINVDGRLFMDLYDDANINGGAITFTGVTPTINLWSNGVQVDYSLRAMVNVKAGVCWAPAQNTGDDPNVGAVKGAVGAQYVKTLSGTGVLAALYIAISANTWLCSRVQKGTATLVLGTKIINTGVEVTATSKIYVSLNTPLGGTQGVKYNVPDSSIVVGPAGTGAFTINALNNTGAVVTTDVSTINWEVVG